LHISRALLTFGRLGVGAPLPKDAEDGMMKRKDKSSLDALRKQLLGRNATARSTNSRNAPATPNSQPKPPVKPISPDDSEDEGGRAAAFTSRNKKSKARMDDDAKIESQSEQDIDGVTKPEAAGPTSTKKASSKRKSSSYLDEMLAEKAKKKKSKKKNQQIQG
jgi:hypothetical protein